MRDLRTDGRAACGRRHRRRSLDRAHRVRSRLQIDRRRSSAPPAASGSNPVRSRTAGSRCATTPTRPTSRRSRGRFEAHRRTPRLPATTDGDVTSWVRSRADPRRSGVGDAADHSPRSNAAIETVGEVVAEHPLAERIRVDPVVRPERQRVVADEVPAVGVPFAITIETDEAVEQEREPAGAKSSLNLFTRSSNRNRGTERAASASRCTCPVDAESGKEDRIDAVGVEQPLDRSEFADQGRGERCDRNVREEVDVDRTHGHDHEVGREPGAPTSRADMAARSWHAGRSCAASTTRGMTGSSRSYRPAGWRRRFARAERSCSGVGPPGAV